MVMEQVQVQKSARATKINKLVLDGFKSFARHTELIFGEDFNVVLGPNGSGKSNVLDAICFVLGKSSSKQLRAEKSSNLIYNGGKTKQPAKSAEVSIVFDNKSKIFPMDDDEIKISRIVRMNGTSKYRINGKTKTRQEVLELLGAAKINPDGYNIILQGDIIRLVEMSPLERRQIIEEIAGISIYEEKKQKALNELQKVEEKLNEAEIILKERETYLKELKKDRNQALKYKKLSDDIKKNKASYLKRQMDKKVEAVKKLEEKSSKYNEKLGKLNAVIEKLRKEITERKERINQISAEIEQKGEVEQVALQKETEKLRIELATDKTRINAIETELSRINQRKEQLQKNLEEVEQKIKDQEKEKKELQDEQESVNKTIADLDKKIKQFKEKHKLVDEAEIDKQIEEFDKQAEEKHKETQALRERQQELVRKKDKAEFQLQVLDEKIAKVKELETAHKEELEALKKKKEEFKKATLELNKLLNQDSQAAAELADVRVKVHKLKEEQTKLQLKQASIKESVGANIAVKKVLENRSKLGEIYGTISDLGSADAKYARALEVAAGRKMHSIVVEDDKTAAACIKFLKQNKFGIATFLPLNKIRPANEDKFKALLKEKGVHDLAINLIEFDPKFKNIFSHVFGNTLVVENIETARKIGIGKAKMVTLDGDICERSGAMVGGWRHKQVTGFKEKDVSSRLSELKKEIPKQEKQIKDMEKQREKAEEKIAELRTIKATAEGEIIKAEKALYVETGDVGETKTYKEELHKSVETFDKELRELENVIQTKTQELVKIKTERQALRNKISELRNPTLLAELNAFEEKKKELVQDVLRVEGELKSKEVQLVEILCRDSENINKILKDMKKEKKDFEKELAELKNKTKDQEKILSEKEEEQSKFFVQFKDLFEQRNRLTDEINERETQILKQEGDVRKEELELNTISIEQARVKAELAGLNTEFAQYEGIELDMEKPEEQLKKEISAFERMMATIGNVNMRALEIYETVEKEYKTLLEKKSTLIKEKEDVVILMAEIETNKKGLFLATLEAVNANFRRIFSQLTTKGDAYLELENKEKIFDEGLRIKVKLTGNKFLDIRSLSGGEKTLTALAFLFSIQEHEPAMFYVLDEVDAALDKHNSEKLAKLIRDYTKKAQYIIISHNDALMAEGDILYGVSMKTDTGISNVVGLKT